jgi:hypothetical protein
MARTELMIVRNDPRTRLLSFGAEIVSAAALLGLFANANLTLSNAIDGGKTTP